MLHASRRRRLVAGASVLALGRHDKTCKTNKVLIVEPLEIWRCARLSVPHLPSQLADYFGQSLLGASEHSPDRMMKKEGVIHGGGSKNPCR